jgi:hypothetical protein
VNLTNHPAADIFPLMEGEDFEALKEDIRKNGLQELIRINLENQILDGRNRHRALLELGVAIDSRVVDLWPGNENKVTDYVVSMNIARRHLTPGQRAEIALKLIPLYEAEAAAREKAGTLASNGARVGKAAEQAAKAVGISTRTVERKKTEAGLTKPRAAPRTRVEFAQQQRLEKHDWEQNVLAPEMAAFRAREGRTPIEQQHDEWTILLGEAVEALTAWRARYGECIGPKLNDRVASLLAEVGRRTANFRAAQEARPAVSPAAGDLPPVPEWVKCPECNQVNPTKNGHYLNCKTLVGVR